jgi:hypothetical protein
MRHDRVQSPNDNRSNFSQVIFDMETAMLKNIVATGFLIAAGIGIWAMFAYVAADPERAAAAKPAIAAVSPLEMMKAHGKNLPPADNVEPF